MKPNRKPSERVHMPMEGFSRFDDTWVSTCGIFEPKSGSRHWVRVTCLRCLRARARAEKKGRKG